MDFKEKVVLITGASSGIGRAAAVKFANRGAKIILVARNKKKLEQVRSDLNKISNSILVCQCDVSDKIQE